MVPVRICDELAEVAQRCYKRDGVVIPTRAAHAIIDDGTDKTWVAIAISPRRGCPAWVTNVDEYLKLLSKATVVLVSRDGMTFLRVVGKYEDFIVNTDFLSKPYPPRRWLK